MPASRRAPATAHTAKNTAGKSAPTAGCTDSPALPGSSASVSPTRPYAPMPPTSACHAWSR